MKSKKSLIALGIILVISGFSVYDAISTHNAADAVHASPKKEPVTAVHKLTPSDIDISQLYTLVNQDRSGMGIAQLRLNPSLIASAQAKCTDMTTKNYWNHNDPEGNTPWHFMTDQGVPYSHLGENLATGQMDAQTVNQDWLNSPEHKANILDAKFTDVGYAVCESPSFVGDQGAQALIVVQHFAQY